MTDFNTSYKAYQTNVRALVSSIKSNAKEIHKACVEAVRLSLMDDRGDVRPALFLYRMLSESNSSIRSEAIRDWFTQYGFCQFKVAKDDDGKTTVSVKASMGKHKNARKEITKHLKACAKVSPFQLTKNNDKDNLFDFLSMLDASITRAERKIEEGSSRKGEAHKVTAEQVAGLKALRATFAQ